LALARTDTSDEKAATAGLAPKPILKADGIIVLDSQTQLSGGPRARLGIIVSATVARSNGFSANTRKRRRKTRQSAKNSTPTASPITRIRSSICSRGRYG
jgi:hypothetical protein